MIDFWLDGIIEVALVIKLTHTHLVYYHTEHPDAGPFDFQVSFGVILKVLSKWNFTGRCFGFDKEIMEPKIKCVLDQIGLGYLWTKAYENDIGILNIIKQRPKDIELQRWLSDVNNDVSKDAN